MKRFFIGLMRLGVTLFPAWGMRLANFLRIRAWSGWLFDCELITRYQGVRLQVNCREMNGFYAHVGQCNEINVLKLLKKISPHYNCFFDIGANMGVFTLLFAHHNPAARIASFEPVGSVFSRLVLNLKLNQLEKIVYPVSAAVCAKSELRPFLPSESPLSQGDGSLMVGLKKAMGSPVYVPCISFQDACHQLDLQPDLLKIDVEGGELDVLDGIRQAIERNPGHEYPDLLLELHTYMFRERPEEYLGQIKAFLRNGKYQVFSVNESDGQVAPVEQELSLSDRSFLFATRKKEIAVLLKKTQ